MKRRWLSCSASSEDRVVSGGACFGAEELPRYAEALERLGQ